MTNNFYSKESTKNLSQLKALAPEQLQAFLEFGGAAAFLKRLFPTVSISFPC